MEAHGVGTKVVMTDYGIRVEPTWKVGSQAVIEIPFEQIASVRWKPASLLSRGWMQFTTAGSPAGILSVPEFQPGSIIFKKSQQASMEQIKNAVQEKISALRKRA